MNIQLIAEQIGRIHLTLETQDSFEVYGGTWLGAFEVSQTGTAQWTLTVREQVVAAAPLRDYKVYARQLATGREWEVLSGKILVSARTAAVPADKLAPVEYFVTVPVVDHDVDAVGSTIVQGIPGPQGPKGDPGPPGEGGMTSEERATLAGAAQRDSANTFTASNTFTGSVDMRGAQVTPPEGWNVEGVTAEQVKSVVPIAFGGWTSPPHADTNGGIAIGASATASLYQGIAVGVGANGGYQSISMGAGAKAPHYGVAISEAASAGSYGVSIGWLANANNYATAIGRDANAKRSTSVTIGSAFEDTEGSYTCTTEGTGSITIGAGANTLNNGDTESSNSVTIGCKALNQGADSVVIGAQAKGSVAGGVVIGAGAASSNDCVVLGPKVRVTSASTFVVGKNCTVNSPFAIVIGREINYSGGYSVNVGNYTTSGDGAVSIGHRAYSHGAKYAIALGCQATVKDQGATVIRSTAEDGTYTQLYFSGANTPLANTYEGGEAMMGYVVRDSAGNVMVDAEGNAMVGTQKLSVLFPNNRGENAFTPAMLSMDEDWTPKPMFHPSDLDMPQEEPSEVEEYEPLPVWPIVEPEVPEDLPPHAEVENL